MPYESVQDKLMRIRPDRIKLKYKVAETDGSEKELELPFVVGVLGDYSGNSPTAPNKDLTERNFVEINRDNFNQVMGKMNAGLSFRVDNVLPDGKNAESELPIRLGFKSLDDFSPANVVEQVEPLRQLQDIRNQLRDLLATIGRGGPPIEKKLMEIISNKEQRQALAGEIEGMPAKKETDQ